MANDAYLLEQIKKTLLFDEAIKSQLVAYFSGLTVSQKELIYSAIEKEKIILLEYLKSLKDREDISVSEIKYQAQRITRKHIQQTESQEKHKTQTEIEALLSSFSLA